MIVSVINLKGGTGKTTTAMALAAAAARDGRRARVLDADPQASASLWAMAAGDAGDELPFGVGSANMADIRRLGGSGEWGEWTFCDCPPNGRVLDEAMRAADFVVVPTTTGAADVVKTLEAVETLEAAGKCYAVLVTRALSNTVSLRETVGELEARGASYFETAIPQREILKGYFGNPPGEDLFGYQEVFEEIKEALSYGD